VLRPPRGTSRLVAGLAGDAEMRQDRYIVASPWPGAYRGIAEPIVSPQGTIDVRLLARESRSAARPAGVSSSL